MLLLLPGGPGTAKAMLCWASPGASVPRSALTLWGLSPNPPCSEQASAGAPLLWALTHWGAEGCRLWGCPGGRFQEKPCLGVSPVLQAPAHPGESPQLTSPCPPALLCNYTLG